MMAFLTPASNTVNPSNLSSHGATPSGVKNHWFKGLQALAQSREKGVLLNPASTLHLRYLTQEPSLLTVENVSFLLEELPALSTLWVEGSLTIDPMADATLLPLLLEIKRLRPKVAIHLKSPGLAWLGSSSTNTSLGYPELALYFQVLYQLTWQVAGVRPSVHQLYKGRSGKDLPQLEAFFNKASTFKRHLSLKTPGVLALHDVTIGFEALQQQTLPDMIYWAEQLGLDAVRFNWHPHLPLPNDELSIKAIQQLPHVLNPQAFRIPIALPALPLLASSSLPGCLDPFKVLSLEVSTALVAGCRKHLTLSGEAGKPEPCHGDFWNTTQQRWLRDQLQQPAIHWPKGCQSCPQRHTTQQAVVLNAQWLPAVWQHTYGQTGF